jgi:hypothetical protein
MAFLLPSSQRFMHPTALASTSRDSGLHHVHQDKERGPGDKTQDSGLSTSDHQARGMSSALCQQSIDALLFKKNFRPDSQWESLLPSHGLLETGSSPLKNGVSK